MAYHSVQKLINIYGMDINRNTLILAEKSGNIPESSREQRGSIRARSWGMADLPIIGERYGFLSKLSGPTAIAVFATKGGVLKTTLSLNIARLAAMHNINTCVVGLDIQGDITKALGFAPEADEEDDLSTAMKAVPNFASLRHLFQKQATLEDLILPTELPTLSLIPESSALAALDAGLTPMMRREYWLLENVVKDLKKQFDLVIMDCSPSWSQITTNALVACDVLISPLETKINHYRNYSDFALFLSDFERTMGLTYEKIAVPTRFNSTRKLCVEIRNWYLSNVPGCTSGVMRESVAGEEAMSMCLSWPEYAPTSVAANEMRDLMREIWSRLPSAGQRHTRQSNSIAS